jgi:O-antigen ligase
MISFGIIIIIVAFNPAIIEAILLLTRAERVFENPRYNLWDISFSIIQNHTIFGVGPGNFGSYMYKYNPIMLNSYSSIDMRYIYEFASVGHSHNFFLFMFSEMGILGLINSILIPYLFFKYSFNLKKIVPKEDYHIYWLVVTIIGCGIGMFARSIFESTGIMTYGWITRDLPFWILFSIIVFYYQKYSKSIV